MTFHTVRLLDALITAARTHEVYQGDDNILRDGLTYYIMNAYNMHSSAQEIVLYAIQGDVTPLKAVKALKALAAMYEDVDA
jgi:hypothetical protein